MVREDGVVAESSWRCARSLALIFQTVGVKRQIESQVFSFTTQNNVRPKHIKAELLRNMDSIKSQSEWHSLRKQMIHYIWCLSYISLGFLFRMIFKSSLHLSTNFMVSSFFFSWVIPHCLNIPYFLYPFIGWGISRLFLISAHLVMGMNGNTNDKVRLRNSPEKKDWNLQTLEGWCGKSGVTSKLLVLKYY